MCRSVRAVRASSNVSEVSLVHSPGFGHDLLTLSVQYIPSLPRGNHADRQAPRVNDPRRVRASPD